MRGEILVDLLFRTRLKLFKSFSGSGEIILNSVLECGEGVGNCFRLDPIYAIPIN